MSHPRCPTLSRAFSERVGTGTNLVDYFFGLLVAGIRGIAYAAVIHRRMIWRQIGVSRTGDHDVVS